MQGSIDSSLTESVVNEAQCDSYNKADSEGRTSTPQNIVAANFVEIYRIPKPDSPDKETVNEEETDAEPDDNVRSHGEKQTSGEHRYDKVEPQSEKNEPRPSELTLTELKKAVFRNAPFGELFEKFREQRSAEMQAEREAEARAAEAHRLAREESTDQEDEEEFAEEEQSEIQPDQFIAKKGGLPAKTAGLTEMEDLIRRDDLIEVVEYSSTEDGIINQFSRSFEMPREVRSLYGALFESLVLPADLEGFQTTRELFGGISMLLQKYVMLPSKDCSLLAYWAIATWFTDYLSFLPSLIVSGPASMADSLFRTLAAVCRRPVLLGELSPAILRKLPINEIMPTLLIREPQLSRYMSALLNASNQPGYLFLSGKTFQQLYCPKCIYVGEYFKDSPAMRNSVHLNLGGNSLTPRRALPAREEITSFQNRLLSYRLLNHDEVATANVRVSGFRPEISMVAEAFAAAIVDDVELQRGIIGVLNDRDEQSRVDRATGVNGLILRAVLFHCHQKDQRKFVREIAATANGFYAEDGESLRLSAETVGHVLRALGLFSHRLGNAGRGLIFDKATQARAHQLSLAYDVHTFDPSCEYCHGLQQSQAEEVVQEV